MDVFFHHHGPHGWHCRVAPCNCAVFYGSPCQRCRISAGYALILIVLLYATAPAVAVFAKTNLIETIHEVPYDEVPEWVTNWEATGLIGFEDKNADGRIQFNADHGHQRSAR